MVGVRYLDVIRYLYIMGYERWLFGMAFWCWCLDCVQETMRNFADVVFFTLWHPIRGVVG